MSFYNEIANILGLDWTRVASGFSIINYNNEACYIEGIKRVVKVTDTAVTLDFKKGRYYIYGTGLEIFLLEQHCIIIKGLIVSTGSEEKLDKGDSVAKGGS